MCSSLWLKNIFFISIKKQSIIPPKKGGKGVCIEPDPKLAEKYIKARPRDQILNLGISCNNEKFSDLEYSDRKLTSEYLNGK
jgi:hypothetical protein